MLNISLSLLELIQALATRPDSISNGREYRAGRDAAGFHHAFIQAKARLP